MIRITATVITTKVVNHKVLGDRAIGELIHQTMYHAVFILIGYPTVPCDRIDDPIVVPAAAVTIVYGVTNLIEQTT